MIATIGVHIAGYLVAFVAGYIVGLPLSLINKKLFLSSHLSEMKTAIELGADPDTMLAIANRNMSQFLFASSLLESFIRVVAAAAVFRFFDMHYTGSMMMILLIQDYLSYRAWSKNPANRLTSSNLKSGLIGSVTGTLGTSLLVIF